MTASLHFPIAFDHFNLDNFTITSTSPQSLTNTVTMATVSITNFEFTILDTVVCYYQ